MKKIKLLLLNIAMASTLFVGGATVLADSPQVDSRASALVEVGTGKILYQENIDEKLPIASVSKIVTMYMVNDKIKQGKGNWEDIVPINDYLINMSTDGALGGTPLTKGTDYTVLDLYKGMILESSNSSTMALGDWVSGDKDTYIAEANKWLTDGLGLQSYKYVSSSGLENSDIQGYMVGNANEYNLFSARDVAVISRQLIKDFPNVLDITKETHDKMSNGLNLTNTNELLKGNGSYDESLNIDGLKTGYTPIAGRTFVGTGEKDGLRLVAVTLDATNYAKDTKNMLRYGYDNFRVMEINNKDVLEGDNISVLNGKKDVAKVKFTEDTKKLIVNKGTKDSDITAKLSVNEINAPIVKDQPVSTLEYVDSKDDLGYLYDSGSKVSIVSTEEVASTSKESPVKQKEEIKEVVKANEVKEGTSGSNVKSNKTIEDKGKEKDKKFSLVGWLFGK